MLQLLGILANFVADFFRPRSVLQAENALLRHQLSVAERKLPRRPRLTMLDRLLFVLFYRLHPGVLDAMRIVRPETVIRWHRMGFRALWRWKSRPLGGRPKISREVRELIRQMSLENPLWGAPRIHGELMRIGIDIAQSTVAKYMAKRRGPPSQGWKTFLRNHADGIASCDFMIIPTIGFKMLYAFIVLGHGRRKLLHIAVTDHATAEWTARQITEAFPWEDAPQFLIRDNDAIFGVVFQRRVRAMGIRDAPTTVRSPWQNGHAERLIGSIRRECLDHLIVINAEHLRRVLKNYARYYNTARTHLSLRKDAPIHRRKSSNGAVISIPHLGGLHHQYARI